MAQVTKFGIVLSQHEQQVKSIKVRNFYKSYYKDDDGNPLTFDFGKGVYACINYIL